MHKNVSQLNTKDIKFVIFLIQSKEEL